MSHVNELDRRDFLVAAGFSLAAVASGCSRSPVREAIPYVNAPEEIVPGRAYWMATTCHGCPARCGMLVKCRDGRPIKVEGNPDHALSRGGLCAVGQAMVLGLYDTLRLEGPRLNGDASEWSAVDKFVQEKLVSAQRVRVLSTTMPSPTTKRVIGEFLARFPDGKHVVYDVPSASAILDAHGGVLPHYRFDKADVIVSFDADFLGTWISPVEFTKQWSSRRDRWHVQLEARLSVTGSKADQRVRLHPNEITSVLAYLSGETSEAPFKPVVLDRIKKRLDEARGRSLVVCGSNRIEDQWLVKKINEPNYGTTIEVDAPSYQRSGERSRAGDLRGTGRCAVHRRREPRLRPARFLAGQILVVSFASHIDETSRLAHAVGPHRISSNRGTTTNRLRALRGDAARDRTSQELREVIEASPRGAGGRARATYLARARPTGTIRRSEQRSPGFPIPAGAATRDIAAAFKKRWRMPHTPQRAHACSLSQHRHARRPPRTTRGCTSSPIRSAIPGTTTHRFRPRRRRLNVKDGDVLNVGGIELPAFVHPTTRPRRQCIGYGCLGTDRFAKIAEVNSGRPSLARRNHRQARRAAREADTVKILRTANAAT
jgi:hypothetical protein